MDSWSRVISDIFVAQNTKHKMENVVKRWFHLLKRRNWKLEQQSQNESSMKVFRCILNTDVFVFVSDQIQTGFVDEKLCLNLTSEAMLPVA